MGPGPASDVVALFPNTAIAGNVCVDSSIHVPVLCHRSEALQTRTMPGNKL